MINKSAILVLDDDIEYVVVDKYDENDTTYIYLVGLDDVNNIIYGKLENDEIVAISDADELEKVIMQVNKHLHEE